MIPKNIVMKHRTHSISQRSRLVIFLLYIVGLLGASWLANGSIAPPLGTEGFWFYSTLPALLLVVLLVTPFFSRPVDSLSYAIAALIALLVADIWSADTTTSLDRSIWVVALCFCVFVVLVTMLTILFYNRNYDQRSRLSKIFYKVSIVFGLPEVVYSIVFLFALIAFHRDSISELIVFGIVWLVIVLALMEKLWRYIMRIAKIQPKAEQAIYIGKIIAHNSPNIILIRVIPEQDVEFGDLIMARNEHGKPGIAIALDYMGYSYGRCLRAYHIWEDIYASNYARESQILSGYAFQLETTEMSEQIAKMVEEMKERLIGIVSQGSTLDLLQIEIVRSDSCIEQGSMLELSFDDKIIDYQVTSEITREESLIQKSSHCYVHAEAKTIGCWDSEGKKYNPVAWLPKPNQYILQKKIAPEEFDRDSVGYFANTNYGVRIDIDKLVTHNTAILGVLGSGKSYLSLELAERIIDSNIKIVCIDSTPQYSEKLVRYYDAQADIDLTEKLRYIGPSGRDKMEYNREEGGSILHFRTAVSDSISTFLSENCQDKIRIIDPLDFDVWKQTGNMFNGRAAMASMSPAEIAQVITSVILKIMIEKGMTKKARCCIIYEEAHSLIPEWNSAVTPSDKAVAAGTARAILQGRKFGLGCLVVTQRTANVAKSILNQCNTVFSLRVFDNSAIDFLENYFGKDYASKLPFLENRHAIVSGIASSCGVPVHIKLNERDKFLDLFRGNIAM